jgi:Right handed beta helix region
VRLWVLAILLAILLGANASAQTITITKGGWYSPQLTNSDAGSYAVSVNTTDYVEIAYAHVASKGGGIYCCPGSNVQIVDCEIDAMNPNVYGAFTGFGIETMNAASTSIYSCRISGFRMGIWIQGTPGLETSAPVQIKYNEITRTNGCSSNAADAWLSPSFVNAQNQIEENPWSHAICLFELHADPNICVGYNLCDNPIESADVIDIYDCSGTPGSPLLIFGNCIEGPLPQNVNTAYFPGFSITTDGNPATPWNADQYVLIDQNYIYRGRGGIALWDGSNLQANNNFLAFDGLTPAGPQYVCQIYGLFLFSGITPNSNTNSAVNNTIAFSQYPVVQESNSGTVTGTILQAATQDAEGSAYVQWLMFMKANSMTVGPNW